MEIKTTLIEEKIDLLYLTDTDTNIQSESEYVIEGYKTIFPLRSSTESKIRIICLVNEKLLPNIRVKMCDQFASIWFELKLSHSNNMLIGGFSRVWIQNGDNEPFLGFFGLNLLIFFENYFCLQNKLFILMK